jgi:Flp pilus assembly pilin Flp
MRLNSPSPAHCRGQVAVEYIVILVLVALLLINGDPSPIERFFDAIKTAYANFTFAMSAV